MDNMIFDEDMQVVRRGKEINFRLLIKSTRLYGAFMDVWLSFPQEVNNKLNDTLLIVTDNRIAVNLVQDPYFPDMDGCAFKNESLWNVLLDAFLMKHNSIDYLCFVIAHELSHVYLNHYRTGKEKDQVEAEATEQAAAWGFSQPSK
jgi:hypothetical protein